METEVAPDMLDYVCEPAPFTEGFALTFLEPRDPKCVLGEESANSVTGLCGPAGGCLGAPDQD